MITEQYLDSRYNQQLRERDRLLNGLVDRIYNDYKQYLIGENTRFQIEDVTIPCNVTSKNIKVHYRFDQIDLSFYCFDNREGYESLYFYESVGFDTFKLCTVGSLHVPKDKNIFPLYKKFNGLREVDTLINVLSSS